MPALPSNFVYKDSYFWSPDGSGPYGMDSAGNVYLIGYGSSNDLSEFAASSSDTTILATATPVWLSAAGFSKLNVIPLTVGEGVRISPGTPAVKSSVTDPQALQANGATVVAISNGFYVRRSGAVDCSVNLTLGS